MDEDNYDDIIFLPSRHLFLKAGGILVAVLALAGLAWVLTEEPKNSAELTYAGTRQPSGREPRTAMALRESSQVDPSKVVGTSGVTAATEPTDGLTSPSVIHDLETISGHDAASLIGRRVDLRVPVLRENNLVTFWVGSPDNRLLVVLHRDVRDGHARQTSQPPGHGILTVERGQEATISGTIQKTPSAEGRFSWDLTAPQRREVERRGIYLLADTVRTTGHGG